MIVMTRQVWDHYCAQKAPSEDFWKGGCPGDPPCTPFPTSQLGHDQPHSKPRMQSGTWVWQSPPAPGPAAVCVQQAWVVI